MTRARDLANLYRPFSHHDYWYTLCKVGSDPLYRSVFGAVKDSKLPLLDIGCGMGVLAFFLHQSGHRVPFLGLDYDQRKISRANEVVEKFFPGETFHFQLSNAQDELPEHQGDVTLLDVLQYMDAAAQEKLLRNLARRVAPGGKLVLRSAMRDNSWRFRFTRGLDGWANRVNWMKGVPVSYPAPEFVHSLFLSEGLSGKLAPLWGRTPFNNYLGVFERECVQRV